MLSSKPLQGSQSESDEEEANEERTLSDVEASDDEDT